MQNTYLYTQDSEQTALSNKPHFPHISIHLIGAVTWHHNRHLSLTSGRCFTECVLPLCHVPVPFLAWQPFRLLLEHKTSQKKTKQTYLVNLAELKTSRTLAMVSHCCTCQCYGEQRNICSSILCQGSSESWGCKFPSYFLAVPQPSRAKWIKWPMLVWKWVIKKFCLGLTAPQPYNISHIPAGFHVDFTTLLFCQWPAVRQFCRFQIMITASTDLLAWWRWSQTTASCWVGSDKIPHRSQ